MRNFPMQATQQLLEARMQRLHSLPTEEEFRDYIRVKIGEQTITSVNEHFDLEGADVLQDIGDKFDSLREKWMISLVLRRPRVGKGILRTTTTPMQR